MDSRIKSLCKGASRADRNAAYELLEIYYADIYSYLRRLCRSTADAEDLTQQTFLKVWSSLGGFNGRSKFSTWLYRIAVNNCLNYLKKQRPTEELFDEITSSGKEDPVQIYKSKKFGEMIKRAVAKLPEVQKAVFTLRTLQDLSYQEVSNILKKPVSTIKVNHHLAVKNLRRYLKGKL